MNETTTAAPALDPVILADFGVSLTHSIDKHARNGLGQIILGVEGIPCSRGCAVLAANNKERIAPYSSGATRSVNWWNVFAIVRHPEFGIMGVTPEEFSALGLPEIKGWE